VSGAGRFPLRIFLFAFFGWAFDFYDLVLLGFIRGDVTRDLHVSPAAEPWVLGVALSASGIGGVVAGVLADRIGKRTMLSATILTYSVGSLVCGLAPSLAVFILGRAVVGLGVGGEWAIGHGMVAEAVAANARGRASAALQAGEPVGVALAAVAGYVLLPVVGWRAILLGSSVTALLALAARASMHLPNEVVPAERRPTLGALARAGVFPRMLAAWLLGVFKLGTYWTCYTWLPGFLHERMGQDLAHSLAWMVTAQTGQLLGMISFGVVADRVGRRFAFCAYSLLTASALAPLAFAWQRLAVHPLAFWGVMLALGLGSGCTAGFGALLAELFPKEIRATAMGTTYNMARGAQLLAPVVVAAMVSAHGLAGGLSVPLVLALATASWVWVLPETRGIALPSLGAAAGSKRVPR
jgi:MFS family permease